MPLWKILPRCVMVVKEKGIQGKDDGAWNALVQKESMLDKMCIKTIESELRDGAY